MIFQNDFGVLWIFGTPCVCRQNIILFESNKIVYTGLSRTGKASALIKKKPDCKAIGLQKKKTNYGKSNVAIVKIERSVGIFFRYGLDEI